MEELTAILRWILVYIKRHLRMKIEFVSFDPLFMTVTNWLGIICWKTCQDRNLYSLISWFSHKISIFILFRTCLPSTVSQKKAKKAKK